MFKKFITVTIALMVVISLFTACGPVVETETNTKSLSICIQKTANTAAPMIGDADVTSTVYETVRSCGSISIVEVDGAPYVLDKVASKIPDSVSDAKKESISKQISKNVLDIAQTAVPKTPEIDVLKGLTLAGRNIDESSDEKTILYLGSSLSTAGMLPFASQNYFDAQTDLLIAQLQKKQAIPQFPQGTKVIFAGIGDTALPQKDLSYRQVEKLKEIMKAICEAGGACVDFISASPVDEVKASDYPTVSTVTVFDEVVNASEVISAPVKLDATHISFEPDSYKLSNKNAAKRFLKPFVKAINASDESIFVCGTTATVGSNENCKAFSLKRAQTIVNLLCEMGADESKLIAKGLGYENAFHICDVDENGSLVETAAQQNRLVLLIPASCEDAKKI